MTHLNVSAIARIGCLAATLCFIPIAEAKKPDKPGGGGGGNNGPSYQIIELDNDDGAGGTLTGVARDINTSRLIVGAMDSSAAFWEMTETNGSIQSELHFFDTTGFATSHAFGCNEWGETVGFGRNDLHPALYWPSKDAPPQVLPATFESSSAHAINNDGVACGWERAESTPYDPVVATAWSLAGGQWTQLELPALGDPGEDEQGAPLANRSSADAIRDEDETTGVISIVGVSNDNAVLWTVTRTESGSLVAGPAVILDPGYATSVNNTGTVTGISGSDGLVWVNGGVGELLPPSDKKDPWYVPTGFPYDVNDVGVVVGYDPAGAVLWTSKDTPLVLLNEFLPKRRSPFSTLTSAEAVSETNEIVGWGHSADAEELLSIPFLAVPVQ
jgi:hypothetical protein